MYYQYHSFMILIIYIALKQCCLYCKVLLYPGSINTTVHFLSRFPRPTLIKTGRNLHVLRDKDYLKRVDWSCTHALRVSTAPTSGIGNPSSTPAGRHRVSFAVCSNTRGNIKGVSDLLFITSFATLITSTSFAAFPSFIRLPFKSQKNGTLHNICRSHLSLSEPGLLPSAPDLPRRRHQQQRRVSINGLHSRQPVSWLYKLRFVYFLLITVTTVPKIKSMPSIITVTIFRVFLQCRIKNVECTYVYSIVYRG